MRRTRDFLKFQRLIKLTPGFIGHITEDIRISPWFLTERERIGSSWRPCHSAVYSPASFWSQ